MRRMISVLTVVALMVAMMVVMAMPAFAGESGGDCNSTQNQTAVVGLQTGNIGLLGTGQGNCSEDNDAIDVA